MEGPGIAGLILGLLLFVAGIVVWLVTDDASWIIYGLAAAVVVAVLLISASEGGEGVGFALAFCLFVVGGVGWFAFSDWRYMAGGAGAGVATALVSAMILNN
jgi:hypothetical protein